MIPFPPLPVLPWKWIAIGTVVLVLGSWGGINHVRLANCKVRAAEFEGAYKTLTRQIQVQNEAVQSLEKKAAAAAQRAAQARAKAAPATLVAAKSADALARVLEAPRAPSECPSGLALAAVRDDLRSRPQTP